MAICAFCLSVTTSINVLCWGTFERWDGIFSYFKLHTSYFRLNTSYSTSYQYFFHNIYLLGYNVVDNKWPLAGLGTTHSHGSRCCWGWRCWATVGWWGTWPRRRWWNVVPGKKKFFKTPSTPDYPKICSHYPPQLTTSIPPPHSIFHTTHYPLPTTHYPLPT